MIFLIPLFWQLFHLLTTSALRLNDPAWMLQQRNVCFGPGTDSVFTLKSPGLLSGLKLEHLHRSSSAGETGNANVQCVKTEISMKFKVMGISLNGPSTAWECGETKFLSYVLQVSMPRFLNAGTHVIQVWAQEPKEKTLIPFFRKDICFDIYVRTTLLRPVTMDLKTSACRTCGMASRTSDCPPSAIEVNKEEVSLMKNGFNILLINPNRTVSKFISFASDEESGFIDFFSSVPLGSVFAVVLQNMCPFNSTSWWYRYLLLHENVTSLADVMALNGVDYRIGIVVGCKGIGCGDIRPQLPYSYVGDGQKMEVLYQHSMGFTFVDPHAKTDKVVSSDSGSSTELGTATTSIIFFMVVTILSLVLVGLFIFKRRRVERNQHPKTNDHAMSTCPNRIQDPTKTEEYGYSPFSEVDKSVEHIYAYVDPQMLRGTMDDSMLGLPMTSRSSHPTCQSNKPDTGESSGTYMAPTSIPKYASRALGTPTIRPSSHSDTSLPTVYETMGCYPEGSVANVTYEEISTAHRKVPAREMTDDPSISDVSNSSVSDEEFDTSNGTEPSSPQVVEEMYVNVGPFRTYSNGSQYITLATGETVDIGEPLYQRISFEEYTI